MTREIAARLTQTGAAAAVSTAGLVLYSLAEFGIRRFSRTASRPGTSWSTKAERLAVMVDRLAELEGLSPAEVDLPDVIEARTAAIPADLVEPAKVTPLEKLGEGERAIRIATAWVLQQAHSWLDDIGKE